MPRKLRYQHHGMSYTPTYKSWVQMIVRCERPAYPAYGDYGGRGIRVCDRWRNSFLAFYADMGDRAPRMTLGRIDPNGNYEPKNCRWESYAQQGLGRRNNRFLSHAGKRLTITQWSRLIGVGSGVISRRLERGWTIEDALAKTGDPKNSGARARVAKRCGPEHARGANRYVSPRGVVTCRKCNRAATARKRAKMKSARLIDDYSRLYQVCA